MTSTQDLCNLGKELGYEGEALLSFIKYEQDTERNIRQETRDHLQLQLELEQARSQNLASAEDI